MGRPSYGKGQVADESQAGSGAAGKADQPTKLVDNFTASKAKSVTAPDPVKPKMTARKSSKMAGGGTRALQDALVKFLDTNAVQALMMVALMLALFLVDSITLGTDDPDVAALDYTLIALIAAFSIELLINVTCRKKKNKLMLAMDFIGTVSILIDISWFEFGSNLGAASTAARVGSRVSRLLRIVRLVRVFKVFATLQRMFRGEEEEEAASASSIGSKLSESVSMFVALLVMLTIVVVSLLNVEVIDGSTRAHVDSFKRLAGDSRAELQPVIDEYVEFYKADIYMDPVSVKIGAELFEFKGANFKISDKDLLKVEAEDGSVVIRQSLRTKNTEEALYNVLLVVCIILELFFFVTLLNGVTRKHIVLPLDRIFTTIKNNAKMVMQAIDTEENEDDDSDNEDNEINTIEAAVEKMAKLVQHVSSGGAAQGSAAVNQVMDDDDVDEDSKAWLQSQSGGGQAGVKIDERAQSFTSTSDKGDTAGRAASKFPRFADRVDINALNSWNFDIFNTKESDIPKYVLAMFDELGIFEAGLCDPKMAETFVVELKNHYFKNPYHNYQHILDVTHTLYRFMMQTQKRAQFTPVEKFAMIVGALAHDMQHPGVNNAFLEKVRDPLAITYNDKSILENNHVSCLYALVEKKPQFNIFNKIDDDAVWKEIRKIIIATVLHTDMTHHFAMVSQLEVFIELHQSQLRELEMGADLQLFEGDDRSFMLQCLLHCADISNPVKPFKIYDNWADCVLEEFFDQGDKEAARGMPKSPMMDRATTAKPMSQINFIEFIVGPLYANMVKIFPELSESAMHLLKNRKLFQQEHLLELERVEGKTLVEKTEEHTKMGNRFEKFKEKFQEMLVKNPRWAEEIDGNLQRVEQANRRSSRMVRGSIMGGGRRQSVSLWGGGKKGPAGCGLGQISE